MPLRRLAFVAVLALLVVPAAHADADPASDILYTQRIYLPFFGEKVSKANAAAMWSFSQSLMLFQNCVA